MARALIVGCGCRGRMLGAELAARGWRVRGTPRTAAGAELIEAAGLEPALADPERVGSVLALVDDVAVVIWALGSAAGPDEQVRAINGERLEHLLERLVETPVRGFVYEGAGTVGAEALAAGADMVRAAAERWRIPVAVVATAPEPLAPGCRRPPRRSRACSRPDRQGGIGRFDGGEPRFCPLRLLTRRSAG